MSAKALGWVIEHSPFSGVTYNVHLMIADTVNDLHHNLFWLPLRALAAKSRCGVASASRALAELVERSFIAIVESPEAGRNGVGKYQFLFPRAPAVYRDGERITGPEMHTDPPGYVPPWNYPDPANVPPPNDANVPPRNESPENVPSRSAGTRPPAPGKSNPNKTLPSGGAPTSSDVAPLDLVAFYVQRARLRGYEPPSEWKKVLGNRVGKLLAEKSPELIRDAISVLAEENKHPGNLAHIVVDLEAGPRRP